MTTEAVRPRHVGDHALFTDYLALLDAVAAARSASTAALPELLDELRAGLHDFELAQHCIAVGRDVPAGRTVSGAAGP